MYTNCAYTYYLISYSDTTEPTTTTFALNTENYCVGNSLFTQLIRVISIFEYARKYADVIKSDKDKFSIAVEKVGATRVVPP